MKIPHILLMIIVAVALLYAGKKFGGMLPSIPGVSGT